MPQVCSKCFAERPLSDFVFDKRYSRYKKKCKFCDAETAKIWRKLNAEKILARNKEYYKSNPEFREKHKNSNLKRQPLYKVSRCAAEAKRRSKKKMATPLWLNEDHLKQIKNFYWLCADLKAVSGQDYHVDHIIPLKGKLVCGLHVPWNLQVLPSDLNIKKSNRV